MSIRELIPRIIKQTETYRIWLAKIKDYKVTDAITDRLYRIEKGNMGNAKYIGDKIYELTIDIGPGYRIYYGEVDNEIILLTNGGTKRRQQKDIDNAKFIFAKYKKENNL